MKNDLWCVKCETRIIENPDTRLCATCSHLARKAERKALEPPKKKKAIKPRSDKRATQERVYSELVRVWKRDKKCAVRGCGKEAENCHHMAGREGDLLLNTKYWMPICLQHHIFYTEYSALAIAHGYSLPRNSKVDQTDQKEN